MIFTDRKSGKKPVEISGFSNWAENLYRKVSDIKEHDFSHFLLQSPVDAIGRFNKKRFLELIVD